MLSRRCFGCAERLFFAPQPQARCSAPRRPLPTRGFYCARTIEAAGSFSADLLSADANAAIPQRFSGRSCRPSQEPREIDGRFETRATTRTIAPIIAAGARKSTRRTAGTSARRMSRIVYPPAPLIAPIMTAAMGVSRKSRALSVPDTEKANSGISQNLAISRNVWYSFGMVGSQSRFRAADGERAVQSRFPQPGARMAHPGKGSQNFIFESTVTH
jgi:hypothetical protein